MNMTYKDNS